MRGRDAGVSISEMAGKGTVFDLSAEDESSSSGFLYGAGLLNSDMAGAGESGASSSGLLKDFVVPVLPTPPPLVPGLLFSCWEFDRFLLRNQTRKIIKARPRMPPTTPPAMAPVLDFEPVWGAGLEGEPEAEPEPDVEVEVGACVGIADVGVGTPLVKGTSLTVARGQASEPKLAVLLPGLRTLSMTWMTPLLVKTLGRITRALFT